MLVTDSDKHYHFPQRFQFISVFLKVTQRVTVTCSTLLYTAASSEALVANTTVRKKRLRSQIAMIWENESYVISSITSVRKGAKDCVMNLYTATTDAWELREFVFHEWSRENKNAVKAKKDRNVRSGHIKTIASDRNELLYKNRTVRTCETRTTRCVLPDWAKKKDTKLRKDVRSKIKRECMRGRPHRGIQDHCHAECACAHVCMWWESRSWFRIAYGENFSALDLH